LPKFKVVRYSVAKRIDLPGSPLSYGSNGKNGWHTLAEDIETFIESWRESGGSERANFQRFADDLSLLLGVEQPKVASSTDQNDDYRFERPVRFGSTSARNTGFIDLYRRGSFVMEGKQGSNAKQTDPNQLTLTQMYNVLEKLRASETIEGRDKEVYDARLIGILKDIHDRIDAAVAEAFGWPADLSDEYILLNHVALNKERADEEAQGHVRWLRPDYQNPAGKTAAKGKTTEMDLGPATAVEKAPWPKLLSEQIAAVREALEDAGEATPEQIARRFLRARTTAVQPLLESLAALGQAIKSEGRRYSV
jgi:hypothetical protein